MLDTSGFVWFISRPFERRKSSSSDRSKRRPIFGSDTPRGMSCEKNVPTQQHKSKANPRVPLAHGDEGRTGRDQSTSTQRPRSTCGGDSQEIVSADLPPFAFLKDSRLRTRRQFRAALSRGVRVYTRRFILYIRRRNGSGPRLGTTVSRKVGNAVVRNRIKRCVREVFRTHPEWFPEPVDLVVVAKIPSNRGESDFRRLRRSDFGYEDIEKEIKNNRQSHN